MPAPATQPAPLMPAAAMGAAQPAAGELVALTPMRRAIAEHMVRSVATSPHAWTMVEVDVTGLVRYRAAKKEEFARREGFPLSYVPFFIEAVVGALKAFPVLNASWTEQGIQLKREINIGVAVALENQQGLVVPVIRHADERNIVGLARAVNDVVARARAGKLTVDDLQGGTFTVNNPGTFGSILSQPIINQPQAAILTMEAIVKRPVVISGDDGDSIAIRQMMNVCLSFDHRVLDGLTAGLFLADLKRRLETFSGSAGL
jgi:2-oxoisovalerate dehydrogenase E2 component (dihydrolipoyl transacylase)